LFTDECKYLKEINETYVNAGTQKKVKEALLHNLKNMQKILDEKVQTSTKRLNDCRNDYKKVQTEFEQDMKAEMDHFKRVNDFEAACD
jgi:hypothetical protein